MSRGFSSAYLPRIFISRARIAGAKFVDKTISNGNVGDGSKKALVRQFWRFAHCLTGKVNEMPDAGMPGQAQQVKVNRMHIVLRGPRPGWKP